MIRKLLPAIVLFAMFSPAMAQHSVGPTPPQPNQPVPPPSSALTRACEALWNRDGKALESEVAGEFALQDQINDMKVAAAKQGETIGTMSEEKVKLQEKIDGLTKQLADAQAPK